MDEMKKIKIIKLLMLVMMNLLLQRKIKFPVRERPY